MAFFTDVVMPNLMKYIPSRSRKKMLKGQVIHIDNAHSHNSKLSQECMSAFKAEQLLHLADGPGISASYFFLFGCIKETMSDDNCASLPDLLKTIAEIFTQINKAMLISVFKSWIKRLQLVIKHEVNSRLKSRKNTKHSSKKTEKTAGYEIMDCEMIRSEL
jgi:hypothetical protein